MCFVRCSVFFFKFIQSKQKLFSLMVIWRNICVSFKKRHCVLSLLKSIFLLFHFLQFFIYYSYLSVKFVSSYQEFTELFAQFYSLHTEVHEAIFLSVNILNVGRTYVYQVSKSKVEIDKLVCTKTLLEPNRILSSSSC